MRDRQIAIVGYSETMMSNLVNCEPDDVRIGMRVRVCWTPTGEYRFPLFEPDR